MLNRVAKSAALAVAASSALLVGAVVPASAAPASVIHVSCTTSPIYDLVLFTGNKYRGTRCYFPVSSDKTVCYEISDRTYNSAINHADFTMALWPNSTCSGQATYVSSGRSNDVATTKSYARAR